MNKRNPGLVTLVLIIVPLLGIGVAVAYWWKLSSDREEVKAAFHKVGKNPRITINPTRAIDAFGPAKGKNLLSRMISPAPG